MPTLDDLERLAKAATPGPWHWDEDREHLLPDGADAYTGESVLFAAPCGYENSYPVISDEDASYIAACSPQTILALCRVAKAAKEWREHGPGQSHCEDEDCPCTSTVCQLKKALAALEQTP